MSRQPFYTSYETAPGKPSGQHAHIVGPCTCPDWTEPERYPEPEPRSLAADILAAVVALIARRTS